MKRLFHFCIFTDAPRGVWPVKADQQPPAGVKVVEGKENREDQKKQRDED